ncbi:MAG: LPS assembly protein LptD [Methyloversatilis sp.]|uniref:LPS assembly protein LptD n=1 Tax=Methyloversatilis sp. TaxID=2569862 RepID=UPI00273605A2|nr:LPS assembly protein LptD [Methyloversatilis sp.]MDP3871971.1 LPS assembly protein LptD [Methyloversatilis sp.]
MLRRSVTFYLVWMSCAAQAADALPQLKVDPSLVPQSRRPAATAKGTTPAKPGGPTAATPTAPAQPATAETVPVPLPGEVVATPVAPDEAVGTPAAATVAAPAAGVPAKATAEPVKPAERAVPAAPADGATAPALRNLPALKVDRALLRQPSSIARRAAPGVQSPDDIPVRGNVSTARNMPPLKVDRALMGAPPVARRVKPAPAEGIAATGAAPGAVPRADAGMPGAAALPSIVPEDDASQMMYGTMTLSEFVARNPDSRVTLLSAESVSGTTDEVMRAEGNAELRRPGTTLTADRINYEPPTEELQADGNVRLVRGEDRIEGPSLRYRLDRSEGVFEKPQYSLRRNLQTGANLRTTTGTGQADRMEFLGENRVRMTNATYSTCGPDNPDWYAKAETLDLNFESDEGEGRNGTIYFKDVPVLYSPWLDFSLNNRRKSGFLSPTFGTTNRTGIDFLLPYYWNIAPNMDATIAPRVLGTRGLMMTNEFRYLNHNYSGIARLDYLFSDRILDRDRHALSLQHTHRITNRLSGRLNYNEVSDRNYYTDLGTRLAITSISYLPQDASLTYSGDWWNATARVTEYQSLANLAPLYSQMPAVTLNAFRADLPFGSVFQMKSSYTDFRISDTTRDEGRRIVVYPQLSLPMQTSYLSVTPKIGVHYSNYDVTRGSNNAGLDTSLTRAIPIFSLDAGTVFERDSDLFGQGYVQTLEPRLYYVLSSYKNQSDFPVFDTALADFNFAQIFSENVFVGQDRIADSNQITAATTSRFIDPENGRERARVALGQRFYLSDQLVTLPGGTPRTERIASTLAAVSGELLKDTYLDAAIQYNTDLSQTERYSVSARYNPRPAHVFNAAYRFRRSDNPAINEVRDIDFSVQWPLTNRWYAVARHNYSVADRRLVEGLGGLEYNGGCWVGRIVFQRIALGARLPGQTTTELRTRTALFFQLELNDFSQIGSNPLDALKRSIPGYGQINQSAADPIFGGDY